MIAVNSVERLREWTHIKAAFSHDGGAWLAEDRMKLKRIAVALSARHFGYCDPGVVKQIRRHSHAFIADAHSLVFVGDQRYTWSWQPAKATLQSCRSHLVPNGECSSFHQCRLKSLGAIVGESARTNEMNIAPTAKAPHQVKERSGGRKGSAQPPRFASLVGLTTFA
jgi:hypothetical protein